MACNLKDLFLGHLLSLAGEVSLDVLHHQADLGGVNRVAVDLHDEGIHRCCGLGIRCLGNNRSGRYEEYDDQRQRRK